MASEWDSDESKSDDSIDSEPIWARGMVIVSYYYKLKIFKILSSLALDELESEVLQVECSIECCLLGEQERSHSAGTDIIDYRRCMMLVMKDNNIHGKMSWNWLAKSSENFSKQCKMSKNYAKE